MPARIVIDRALCDGNALCCAQAPAYLALDDEDVLQLRAEHVSAADLPAVRRAVAICPKAALALEE